MRDKNGRFTKNVTATVKDNSERWTLRLRSLTDAQRKIVADFFVQNSGQSCYNSITSNLWGVLSSHNNDDQYILDKSIARKAGSFADRGRLDSCITFEQFEEIAFGFRVPEKWCIKSGDSDVIRYCNQYGAHCPYTEDECTRCYSHFPSYNTGGLRVTTSLEIKPGYTEITLEQFRKYVLKQEEFVLPKQWCLGVTPENKSVIEGWRTDQYIQPDGGYVLSPDHSRGQTGKRGYFVTYKPFDTPEITFEQFKKYVLNQKEETMKTKKQKRMIGYKLIKPEYSSVALSLARDTKWCGHNGANLDAGCAAESYLRAAGVLDLWFEPIYEDEKPNVEVRGYQAMFDQYGVTFGCQKYTNKEILDFVAILDKSGLVLATNHKEVIAIARYLKKQK